MTDLGGFEPPSGPPAGWYPDPYGGPVQRYWDGRAWDLTTPGAGTPGGHHDSNLPGDYPNVGDWLDRSFRVAYRRWRALALLALLTVPASTTLVYLALDRAFDGLVIEGDELTGWTSDRVPGVIVFGLLATLIGAIGTLSITTLMLREIDGDDLTERSTGTEVVAAGRSLLEALKVLPRAIGWFLALIGGIAAFVAVFTILTIVTGGLALLLIFVMFPAIIWLGVKWWFVVMAIIDRSGNPFPRSSEVSTGRWWSTFGRILLIGIIAWLISAAVQTVAALVVGGDITGLGSGAEITIDDDGNVERFALDEELDFGTTTIIAASIASFLSTVLASSVVTSASTVLYRARHPRR